MTSPRGDIPDPADISHHYAGVFLITDTGRVVGQRRDDIPTIDNPGKVAAFGGTVDSGEEPAEAAWRELTGEETNLRIRRDELVHLLDDIAWRALTAEWEVRHFYYARITTAQLEGLEVYEGEDWAYIRGPADPDLVELWREPARRLFEALRLEPLPLDDER